MNYRTQRRGEVYAGKVQDGQVWACGRWMRLETEAGARAAGMGPLTDSVNLITEAATLESLAADMERAGCDWCLVMQGVTVAGAVASAEVWRAGIETPAQSERKRQDWALKRVRANMEQRMDFLSPVRL